MKECRICHEPKSLDSFNKKKSSNDGRRLECKVCTRKAGSSYYQSNKERITQYRVDTNEKDRQKKWRSKNQHVKNSFTAEYRAQKLLASPKWLNKEQKEEIRSIYKKAKELNLTVDHIVPLNGETVNGLHVPWNLQLLTLEENIKKSNRLNGDNQTIARPPNK